MQESIILSLNSFMASSPTLIAIIPVLADIFVFSYPLYLIYLYFIAHDHQGRRKKLFHPSHDRQHKYQALTIFSSFVGSIIINYILKAFVEQPRPYKVLELLVNPKESLILNSIPHDSFPSDHAAVGMTIAICLLIIGYSSKDDKKIAFWRFFIVFALIMDVCRITIGVHRPIDIFTGAFIGASVAILLTRPSIQPFLTNKIYTPIVDFQEKIFSLLIKKIS